MIYRDSQLELDVLAAVLADGRLAGSLLRMLEPDDFATEAGRQLFDAICSVAKREGRQAVAPATVRDELRRLGMDEQRVLLLLDPLLGIGQVGSFEPKCRRLRDLRRTRSLAVFAEQISKEPDIEQAVALLYDAMADVSRLNLRETPSLADLIDELLDERERELRHESRVRTGLPTLDALLSGGFAPGWFVVCGGRTGVGKTVFGVQTTCRALAAGQRVLYVALEESRTRLVERVIRHREKISRTPRDELDPLFGAALNEELRALPLVVENGPTELDALLALIGQHVSQREGLALVVVDYLQLLRAAGHTNRTQELGEITARLKNAAMSNNVAILGLAQVNRSPMQRADRRPTLTDLRDSGSLEQDADAVVLLHREGELSGKVGALRLAKNRYGSPAEFDVAYDYPIGRISEVSAR